MNRLMTTLACTALLAASVPLPAHAQFRTPRPSPNASIMQTIGLTTVTVTYSRPGVKGRTIWGDLVPYEEPWRTGANEATTIAFSEDVTIQGKPLAAGTYSFLTIPHRGAWTVVFNKEKDLWGASGYKPEQDALRIDVTPTTAEHQEWMGFTFEDLKVNSGNLVLRWEKLKLTVPIATDDLEQTVANAKAAVDTAKADDARTPYNAASFMLSNDQDLALAAQWCEKATKISPSYLNQSLMARILAKQGKTKDAIAWGEKAIATGKASKDKPDTRPTEKLVAEWKAAK